MWPLAHVGELGARMHGQGAWRGLREIRTPGCYTIMVCDRHSVETIVIGNETAATTLAARLERAMARCTRSLTVAMEKKQLKRTDRWA